jgi:hypothetical protein
VIAGTSHAEVVFHPPVFEEGVEPDPVHLALAVEERL